MSEDNPENKLVITAALAGSFPSKQNNPNVPYTPEEFGDEAKRCYDAGAAIVHIHTRDPETGYPTHDLDLIKAILKNIKSKAPDLIINITTSIGEDDQRIIPIQTYKPLFASLNTASMNYAVGNFKTGKVLWGAGNIFANTFETILEFAKEMKKAGIKPEIEIYDLGGLYNILFLNKQEGVFTHPLHFQFVWGVLGGIPFTPKNFLLLLDLILPGATWSVCGVAKQQFQAGLCAVAMGGHIRVGLEDNIRVITGELAKGSYEQVAWAKRVAEDAGRDIAQGEEARKIFHLKQEHVVL